MRGQIVSRAAGTTATSGSGSTRRRAQPGPALGRATRGQRPRAGLPRRGRRRWNAGSLRLGDDELAAEQLDGLVLVEEPALDQLVVLLAGPVSIADRIGGHRLDASDDRCSRQCPREETFAAASPPRGFAAAQRSGSQALRKRWTPSASIDADGASLVLEEAQVRERLADGEAQLDGRPARAGTAPAPAPRRARGSTSASSASPEPRGVVVAEKAEARGGRGTASQARAARACRAPSARSGGVNRDSAGAD